MEIECNMGPVCSVGSFLCAQMLGKGLEGYTSLILLEKQEMDQN